jgi:hypothetical protein
MTDSKQIAYRIETLCDHISAELPNPAWQENTEKLMRQLQQALADYFEARKDEPPPTLGIHVGDVFSAEDKVG